MFHLMIACGVSGIFELILVTPADSIDHVVETVDNVKGINTDLCIREYVFCQGRKAAAHIAAEVFDLFAFFQGKGTEILLEIDTGDLVQNVDDCMGIAVRDVAVVFIEIPFPAFRAPYAAVAFEFIDTECFREGVWPAKTDVLKDGMDQAFRDMVPACYFSQGKSFHEIDQDCIKESPGHMQGVMNPIGSFVESGAAVLAEEPALVKGDGRALLAIDEMTYSLPGAGVLNDTIVRAAMGALSLFSNRQMNGNQVIVRQVFNGFDSCFLWESCNVVAGFHSCFTSFVRVRIFHCDGVGIFSRLIVAMKFYQRKGKTAMRASNSVSFRWHHQQESGAEAIEEARRGRRIRRRTPEESGAKTHPQKKEKNF